MLRVSMSSPVTDCCTTASWLLRSADVAGVGARLNPSNMFSSSVARLWRHAVRHVMRCVLLRWTWILRRSLAPVTRHTAWLFCVRPHRYYRRCAFDCAYDLCDRSRDLVLDSHLFRRILAHCCVF